MADYSNKGLSTDKVVLWILVVLVFGAYLPVAFVIEKGILSSFGK